MDFDVDKPKGGAKSKIPKKRADQIEWYVDEIDDNAKQFARELNELPMSEDNRDNIMLQDIINKSEIAADNSINIDRNIINRDRCRSICSNRNRWANTSRTSRS